MIYAVLSNLIKSNLIKSNNFRVFSSRVPQRVSTKFNQYDSGVDPQMEMLDALGKLGIDLSSPEYKPQFGRPVITPKSAINGKRVAPDIRGDDKESYAQKVSAAKEAGDLMKEILTPHEMADFLITKERVLENNRAAVQEVLTLEIGKTRWGIDKKGNYNLDNGESGVEVTESTHAMRVARAMPGNMSDVVDTSRDSREMRTHYVPITMAGNILPGNFPYSIKDKHDSPAIISLVSMVSKPSENTSLSAIASQRIHDIALTHHFGPDLGSKLANANPLLLGDGNLGQMMAEDLRIKRVVFTGSTPVGRHVNAVVSKRMGATTLEMEGNNAVLICLSAVETQEQIKAIAQEVVFSAIGMGGQRCTSLRRLVLPEEGYDSFMDEMIKIYHDLATNKVGDPRQPGTVIPPLFTQRALDIMQEARQREIDKGNIVHYGEVVDSPEGGAYVQPGIVEAEESRDKEVFAPLLTVLRYPGNNLQAGIDHVLNTTAGLAASVYTGNLAEQDEFVQAVQGTVGMIGVNAPTTRNQTGGAKGFGGANERSGFADFGAGGTQSWKAYHHEVMITRPVGRGGAPKLR